jgi:hypothetical protein
MQKIIKYILAIILVLLTILFFIKDWNLTNNEKFTTVSDNLNKIKNICDPYNPDTSDINDCNCKEHKNSYALYDSNDDKNYDTIAHCNLGDNQWKWRVVASDIRYNSSNYEKCSSENMSNTNLYACKKDETNKDFALWDVKNDKWVTK